MSTEKGSAPDISKIISVLMENPDIIERISSLMKSEGKESADGAAPVSKDVAVPESEIKASTEPTPDNSRTRRRSQLLHALKPYVKSERAQAIDSVIAIADIIDMMRR